MTKEPIENQIPWKRLSSGESNHFDSNELREKNDASKIEIWPSSVPEMKKSKISILKILFVNDS